MLTTFGLIAFGEPEVDQRVQAGIRHGKHVSATATVATVGAAKFFVFFVTKRDAAVPAVAGDHVDIRFIYEFHGGILKRKAPTSGAFAVLERWIRRVSH